MKERSETSENAAMNAWQSDQSASAMFEKFAREISAWSKTGKEPTSADRGIRYFLDLQEKRLQKKGLTMDLSFETRDMPVMKVANILGSLSRYNQHMHFRECRDSLSLYRNGRKVYRHHRNSTLYETIMEPTADSWGNEELLYNCPNCGAVSKLRDLTADGCQYCGTHFLASELYPKVTNYYRLDSYDRKVIQPRAKKICIVCAVIGFLFSFLSLKDVLPIRIFTGLVTGGLAALLGYMGYSLTLLGKLLVNASHSADLLGSYRGKAGSRRKLTQRLLKFDPTFTYEYLEGRALSLFRMIAFSDQPERFVQFDGELPRRFANLVNSEYRGAVGIDDVGIEGDNLYVDLRMYMTNIYDRPGRLRARNEVIRMRMTHKARYRLQNGFSIFAVKCRGCGVGFDASHLRRCPYCGTDYRPEWEDWVVTRLD